MQIDEKQEEKPLVQNQGPLAIHATASWRSHREGNIWLLNDATQGLPMCRRVQHEHQTIFFNNIYIY